MSGTSLLKQNDMDCDKHTKLRIYLKINCKRNREVNAHLLILSINDGACQ
jgi:hypothetical protein